ncbi:MAG TPA: tetratricopeptide repeat protein [Candidatus Sulfotelmatobacter sp.]|nr:tetratricopeptide repeat protein [Candidatus Sulfotelmatobacter sp.]
MPVSSARITLNIFSVIFLAGLLSGAMWGQSAQNAPPTTHGASGVEPVANDPATVFAKGQAALNGGKLDEAERDFRQVLELDPQAGPAYANLGVVYMRRKQWGKALQELRKAEKMMPQVVGIRLNIGLAYFRQNDFLKAIPPLEGVVSEQPQAVQPRYLLGLCYFFDDRWADAVKMLEPLWPQESEQFPYLYVLSNAAHRAGLKELDERAAEQLTKVGNGTAQYHLFVGKYYLNREEYDSAMTEFETAAKQDPKLAFVHFNLGLAYMGKQEYAQARQEFLKDAAIEPDVALNYEEIGNSYWLTQDDASAEKNYRVALKRDPRLVNSMLGLAKIYQRQQKYSAALAETDAALKVDPERTDAHYVRAQALLHLGRKAEAKQEMVKAAGNTGESPNKPLPSPELVQDQQ